MLSLILVLYLILGFTYALITPPFEASDELWHYPMIRHLADGNLHVEVFGPDPDDETADEVVLRCVADHGGSISAEHGVGRAKAAYLHLSRTPAELAMMRSVKDAIDPHGLFNPGAVFAG